MKPQFEFLADSTEPGITSGMASWSYTIQVRGEDSFRTHRKRFESFAMAHDMNDLIDAEHEKRKIWDNLAAVYARMIRENGPLPEG